MFSLCCTYDCAVWTKSRDKPSRRSIRLLFLQSSWEGHPLHRCLLWANPNIGLTRKSMDSRLERLKRICDNAGLRVLPWCAKSIVVTGHPEDVFTQSIFGVKGAFHFSFAVKPVGWTRHPSSTLKGPYSLIIHYSKGASQKNKEQLSNAYMCTFLIKHATLKSR